MKEFNQFQYQNDYNKKKYDRLNLNMPKGKKEKIEEAAAAAGMKIGEFINAAIDEKIEQQAAGAEEPDPVAGNMNAPE